MKNTPHPFDTALHLLPAPVTVVGVRSGEVWGGLTAAWVTRVSVSPPMLLVAIGHERRTWELMEPGGEFTISVLRESQVGVARLFGLQSRRQTDKWAACEHVMLGAGTPALKDCTARYLCREVSRLRTGDHDCIVGEIMSAETVSGAPALPMRGADYAPKPGEDS